MDIFVHGFHLLINKELVIIIHIKIIVMKIVKIGLKVVLQINSIINV